MSKKTKPVVAKFGDFLLREKPTRCYQCKKKIRKVLVQESTTRPLCSLRCFDQFWLDILY